MEAETTLINLNFWDSIFKNDILLRKVENIWLVGGVQVSVKINDAQLLYRNPWFELTWIVALSCEVEVYTFWNNFFELIFRLIFNIFEDESLDEFKYPSEVEKV